jgi:hypothetical protein
MSGRDSFWNLLYPNGVTDMESTELKHLYKRLSDVEYGLKEVRAGVVKVEKDYDSFKDLMVSFQISVAKMSEYTEKIKTIDVDIRSIRENDLRNVRESLVRYDIKLQSIEDLKKICIGTICAALPASLGVIMEVMKYLIAHKVF